jgi:hypothetical protein
MRAFDGPLLLSLHSSERRINSVRVPISTEPGSTEHPDAAVVKGET